MARLHTLVLAAVLVSAVGFLACTTPQSSGPVSGDDDGLPVLSPVATVRQGVVPAPVQPTAAGAPTPFTGQIGDEVSASGVLHVLYGDPVPDSVTRRSGPGFARFYLAPDDPYLPQFWLVVDGPEPLLSQALTSSTPIRVRVTGTLLDPIPLPVGLQAARIHVTSLSPA